MKTKSVAYWQNQIVGQKNRIPQSPEDEANYDIALALVKVRDPENRKVA